MRYVGLCRRNQLYLPINIDWKYGNGNLITCFHLFIHIERNLLVKLYII